ncbi:RlmE family RNA methyltransferase [Oharaeibacter diazotrophicus]|uniref:Ribosomal RNA large subunit methyltransferase E n=1 Tax=Oharaeibacter diazotrophicus TaxID=1920512 RepID=A0A4V3CWJ5_9HYPH|nr:RlmE family RNA methyltransferase [Oharaeibacter diazotrophicus]TDP86578.1 23S rRNA (uridine2552-2'-O)-methyltransferase [Oharaeibacter diazotrophicus]BBE71480.1 ribosomal RNA large subunit methyltransferase E [Pleomorphomonas sp. SM30]GLS78241.1 ribosomal RNA large subunit methyltransferase E [Oharaeibacter diazotrophicus]
MADKKTPDKPKGKGRADTGLKVRVKTARGRTASSTRWLQRQLNDPYVVKARKEGWRSRAAFKLIEIDEKHKLLKRGQRVVDLGAAPGGWCQVAARITGSTPTNPLVVGIDFLEMDAVTGVTFLQKDFLDEDAPAALMAALGGHNPDVVLSDMASPTTGHHKTDYLRTAYLCEVAAAFAVDVLNPGGSFVAKVFRGGTENDLLALLKQNFAQVFHIKPPSSRQESVEMYVVAKGFKGRRAAPEADGDETG